MRRIAFALLLLSGCGPVQTPGAQCVGSYCVNVQNGADQKALVKGYNASATVVCNEPLVFIAGSAYAVQMMTLSPNAATVAQLIARPDGYYFPTGNGAPFDPKNPQACWYKITDQQLDFTAAAPDISGDYNGGGGIPGDIGN